MMDGILTDPKFFAMTMKAQDHMAKSRRAGDKEHISGTFTILDMLDMLDAELDKSGADTAGKETET